MVEFMLNLSLLMVLLKLTELYKEVRIIMVFKVELCRFQYEWYIDCMLCFMYLISCHGFVAFDRIRWFSLYCMCTVPWKWKRWLLEYLEFYLTYISHIWQDCLIIHFVYWNVDQCSLQRWYSKPLLNQS